MSGVEAKVEYLPCEHRYELADAKDLCEILTGQPVWGRQMQVGWVKIGDFRRIT